MTKCQRRDSQDRSVPEHLDPLVREQEEEPDVKNSAKKDEDKFSDAELSAEILTELVS